MPYFISVGLSFLVLIFSIYTYFSRAHICTAPRRLVDVKQCRLILRRSTLSERAIPNQRLITAFSIDNAFTTTDPSWHKEFVALAKEKMGFRDGEQIEIAGTAERIISQEIEEARDPGRMIPLVVFVQGLVFQIVMMKFFPDVPIESDTDIEFMTSKINYLWLLSKTKESSELHQQKASLMEKLQDFFPVNLYPDLNDRNNPLNILLPAYETLWRIVLRSFIEISFRKNTNILRSHITPIFRTFLNDPTQSTFEAITDGNGTNFSIKDLVRESLRLYPPTRRIYREFSETHSRVAIDIEALHRDSITWGNDALVFNPCKWSNVSSAM